MSPECFLLHSIGSRVNPTPDFPFFQRGNSTHAPGEIHFLTFSLQIWGCGAASCAHRLPKDSFLPSSTIFFFILGKNGEIFCSGFPFQSLEARWSK